MTLAYSRHRFVRFVFKQDVTTWIDCHVQAFSFFGGVPQTVLLDNLKAGVVKPDRYDPTINRSYAECARYYGFIIDPAKVRKPEHKGKVERSIQIVRQQILAGRSYDHLEQLNQYALNWCKNIIANEITRTTGRTPNERFSADEQSALIALPAIPYEFAIWQEAQVGRDQHITFEGNFYSLPINFVSKRMMIRATQSMLFVYDQGKQIKAHQRLSGKGHWSTDNNDLPDNAKYYLDNTADVCLAKAQAIGSGSYRVISSLLNKPSATKLRKAQAILRLAEHHTPERLEQACLYALEFGQTKLDALKNIINHSLDQLGNTQTPSMSTQELSEGAFLRDPNEFLIH